MELKTDQNLKKHFVVSIVVALSIILSIVAATFAWYTAKDNAVAAVGEMTLGGFGDETMEETGKTFTFSNPPFAKPVISDNKIIRWQVKSPLGLVDYSGGNDETTLDTPAYTDSYELGLIYSGEIENETEHTFTIQVTKTITQIDKTEDIEDYTEYLEYALVSSDGTIRFSSDTEIDSVSTCSFEGEKVEDGNTIEYHETLTLYVWFDTDSQAEGAKLQNFELNLHVDFVEATE